MNVQQYRIYADDLDESRHGQFVFADDESNEIVGFISDTDSDTYIDITLFGPIDSRELPEDIENVMSRVDWQEVFADTIPLMPDEVYAAWKEGANKHIH